MLSHWVKKLDGSPLGEVITEFGSGIGAPDSITAGPDGNIWFTMRFVPKVGRITPTGQMSFFHYTGQS
jgi:streptogramin lyase